MKSSGISFPNFGTHAWLHRHERALGIRIGDAGGYPLPKPVVALPVRLEQRFGFSCQPLALWHQSKDGEAPTLEWSDFGVFAPTGPMPEHYTESAIHASGGMRLRNFISNLTQRIAHLYYRSWAQLRPECEGARPDDRFRDLLSTLTGGSTTCVPHIAWHRPTLSQIPRLAAIAYGVRVKVQRYPISRVRHDDTVLLGTGILGRVRLGREVYLYGAGFIRLWIQPSDIKQFLKWRNCYDDQRKEFERMVKDRLPLGNRYEVRLIAPRDLETASISSSRLGQCRFTFEDGKL